VSGLTPSILERQLYVAVKAFLVTVTGLDPSLVLQGLPNRSAMPPASPGFVTMQLTGGTRLNYNVDTWDTTDPAPSIISSETHWKEKMQVDFYGAGAGDWSRVFAGLWKDETACLALEPVCDPLYANDPMLAPLDDDEQQYESRWTVEAFLQYNPVTSVPMQFADTFEVTLISVDEAYPP
jgi:hypothetical protein